MLKANALDSHDIRFPFVCCPFLPVVIKRRPSNRIAEALASSGERIAVVFEEMSENPRIVYPIAAYPVPPKRAKKGRKR
jgi:hypothetical protein